MNAFDHGNADATTEPQRSVAVTALWAALAADHRARDERTARLRAMRLIGGEDEPARTEPARSVAVGLG